MPSWNLWHGCRKISPGCLNCYVYRTDGLYGKDSSVINKNKCFELPISKNRNGEYKIQPQDGIVYTCFTSDFFIEQADAWRGQAWQIMKIRSDLTFLFITKRINRIYECLPSDWGNGYENVVIGCTAEDQKRADIRLPVFLSAPIKHRIIICEPILEYINISKYLNAEKIEEVVAGGESGINARICDFSWILGIRSQCINNNIKFTFKQTGAYFFKDGKEYRIKRKYQHSQAKKADIDYLPGQRR